MTARAVYKTKQYTTIGLSAWHRADRVADRIYGRRWASFYMRGRRRLLPPPSGIIRPRSALATSAFSKRSRHAVFGCSWLLVRWNPGCQHWPPPRHSIRQSMPVDRPIWRVLAPLAQSAVSGSVAVARIRHGSKITAGFPRGCACFRFCFGLLRRVQWWNRKLDLVARRLARRPANSCSGRACRLLCRPILTGCRTWLCAFMLVVGGGVFLPK